jgi:hypothetical protein
MKSILIIFFVLGLASCRHELYESESYMNISVIRDVTDPHVLQPDANPVLGLFNLSENRSARVNFRYREISDKVLVPVVDLHLPDESVTNRQNRKNEPLFRERAILNFYETIRKTLNADTDTSSSLKDHSECFKAISSELNLLVQSNSKNRFLLVFSNLYENSSILSVYDKTNNRLLAQNPRKIADQFEKTHLLPESLKGIKVFFLFQPVTREEDQKYLELVSVYRSLLESRGATVRVQANNNY